MGEVQRLIQYCANYLNGLVIISQQRAQKGLRIISAPQKKITEPLPEPFYHWSHSGPETFNELLGIKTNKFIYLHRDPRDAAISWASDFHNQNLEFKDWSHRDIIKMVVTHNQPPTLEIARRWLQQDCLICTFDQLKSDTYSVVSSIAKYVGLDFPSTILDEEGLREIVARFAFETITGRNRGEVGKTIRGRYMFRKGLTGGWKRAFDEELISLFEDSSGLNRCSLGYLSSSSRSRAQNFS